MPLTREQIFAEAKSLDLKDREELIEDLRQTLDHDELSAEQLAELRRRAESIDRGEALLDGEQAMSALRKQFEK